MVYCQELPPQLRSLHKRVSSPNMQVISRGEREMGGRRVGRRGMGGRGLEEEAGDGERIKRGGKGPK